MTRCPSLPSTSRRRLAVRVTPDALRRVRAGHPWIFDRSIRTVSHHGAAGDLAVVFDDHRRFAAIGLWDPESPIRIRVLHAGEPRTIDRAFFSERARRALERRRALVDDETTTAYRVLNGESDGFGGLVLDRYQDTAVCKLYTAAWLPHLATVVHLATEVVGTSRLVLRLARNVGAGPTHDLVDGQVLEGNALRGPVEFLERGVRFGADVRRGQKTGHFLDQRDNRVLVGGLAAGAEVLDVFSCTGGFALHAAVGGAVAVHATDRSGHALSTVAANRERNLDHTAVRECTFTAEQGDAFEVLERHARVGRRWGVVVVDPPSFAPRAELVPRALRAYAQLTELALRVTEPGGLLVQSSCSSRVDATAFHEQVRAVAEGAGHVLEEVARTGHPEDHPATFPEARYLKTIFARVDP